MRRPVLVGFAVLAALGLAVAVVRWAHDDGPTPGRPIEDLPANGRAVPLSIASDCSQNVERELTAFFAGVPDGSDVQFPRDGCYAQGGRIEVRDKRDVTIDGNGSTFKSSAPNSGLAVAPNWLLLRGRDVRLTDMRIVGNFHLGGPRSQKRVADATVAGVGNQFNMGVGIYGGDGIHVTHMTIEDVFGDGVTAAVAHYLDGPAGQPLDSPRDVHVERVAVTTAARHCFSPSQAVGFWLQDSAASDCWYGGMDAELDDVKQKLQGIHVLRNTFDGFNLFGVVVPVAGDGANTSDIEIRDNRFLTVPDAPCNTIVEVGIYPSNPNTIKHVVVEGNTMKARGVGVAFDHVDGGAIRDNRIARDGESCSLPAKTPLVRVTNSTGVTAQDDGLGG
jgi:hypothetical protein